MNPLDPYRQRSFALSELEEVSGALLGEQGPDARTLRYWQSLGIVDRPVRYDGRQAIYGFRSLLQAVAVRALQGQGFSLAQIQAALTGVSTARLEEAVAPAVALSPPPVAPSAGVRLLTEELAPGVTVTVDPRRVPDPESVFARIRSALGGSP